MTFLPSSTALLKDHYQYFRKNLAPFLGVLTLDLLHSLLEMLPPLFSLLIFDHALPEKNINILFMALGGGFATYLAYFGVSALGEYLNLRLDQKMNASLAARLFEKISQSQVTAHQKFRSGDLMVRMTDDADVITGLLLNLPSRLLMISVQVVLFLSIALWMDPWVIILALIAMPFYFWETHYYSKKLETTQEEIQKRDASLYDGLQEKLNNLKIIKAFHRENFEKENLYRLFIDRSAALLRKKFLGIVNAFANSFILQIWTIFVTAYLGFEVIRGGLTVGQMISLGIYLPMIQTPIRELSSLWSQVRVGSVSLRRVQEVLDLPSENSSNITLTPPPHEDTFNKSISFQDVSFHYNDGKSVLSHLNFDIPSHKLTAIVGASGAGKSTLLNLLLKMYQPSAGDILLGDQSLRHIDTHTLRQKMGIVFQEASLFSGSVMENIRYGHPNASINDVKESARKANADGFITELPQTYDTHLLPWGQNLSGGQRQRIALARALLLNPSILILDEVTATLDAESEFLIESALQNLKNDMTIVMITHQLAAAKNADQIIYLDDGRVTESGTFQNLMAQKGSFFDLYNIQTGGFQEFRRRFEVELQRHYRYKEPLSLIILEVQDYTTWRQSETPESANLLMQHVAQLIHRQLRVMDFCSLYTKNQVVIALPQTNESGAQKMVERISPLLQNNNYTVENRTYKSKFKFGIASCRDHEWNYLEQLFTEAEASLKSLIT